MVRIEPTIRWLRIRQLTFALAALLLVDNVFPLAVRSQPTAPAAARRASVHWNQVPLADACRRLSETFGTTTMVDRRVDPNLRISLDLQNVAAADAVAQTAYAAEMGACQISSLWYLGPRATANQMRTLAAARNEEAARLPVTVRAGVTQKRPQDWPRLTEPRKLVATAVAQRGWQAVGVELIPHDLWPAGKLPDLTLAEQLTVLLAGFDLTFRFSETARTVEIVPISGPVTINRRYRLRYGETELAGLRQQFPNLSMKLDGEFAAVDATAEDHERIATWMAGPASRGAPRTPTGPSKSVFTLRVEEQSVRAIMDALTQRANWQFDVDEPALRATGLSLDRRVSFEVKNASQEELLKALLQPAGLTFRKDGERVKIVPAGERKAEQ